MSGSSCPGAFVNPEGCVGRLLTNGILAPRASKRLVQQVSSQVHESVPEWPKVWLPLEHKPSQGTKPLSINHQGLEGASRVSPLNSLRFMWMTRCLCRQTEARAETGVGVASSSSSLASAGRLLGRQTDSFPTPNGERRREVTGRVGQLLDESAPSQDACQFR